MDPMLQHISDLGKRAYRIEKLARELTKRMLASKRLDTDYEVTAALAALCKELDAPLPGKEK